jgi:DNA topoisomerase IA
MLQLDKRWDMLSPNQKEEYLLQITDHMDLVDKYSNFMWNELPDEVTNNIVANSSLKENQNIKRTMNKSTLKALIKECYNEVLRENEEMSLPVDTGKNINMGFDNNVGLDVNKRMSGNMDKVMAQIEMLKNKLAPFIADFKAKKLSKEQYMEATKGLVADLKKAQMALELMMAKL